MEQVAMLGVPPVSNQASMESLALSALIAFAAITSAFAQTTVSSEFYVVRDEATKKCTIVDKKPTTTTSMFDNGVFKTRAEAETGHEDHEGLHDQLGQPRRPLMGHQV